MSDDIVARLREEGFVTHIAQLPRESKLLHEAADEIERLRAERDEARQRYCFAMAEHGEEAEARQTANEEGWDCFNDNKNA